MTKIQWEEMTEEQRRAAKEMFSKPTINRRPEGDE